MLITWRIAERVAAAFALALDVTADERLSTRDLPPPLFSPHYNVDRTYLIAQSFRKHATDSSKCTSAVEIYVVSYFSVASE